MSLLYIGSVLGKYLSSITEMTSLVLHTTISGMSLISLSPTRIDMFGSINNRLFLGRSEFK